MGLVHVRRALFQKILPNNLGPVAVYLRTASEHHLFFADTFAGGTLYSFTGVDPTTGMEAPTFFVPTSATVDANGTIYARADGGVLRRQ
jgi:hypothetical protein